jgi:hypothetical protein
LGGSIQEPRLVGCACSGKSSFSIFLCCARSTSDGIRDSRREFRFQQSNFQGDVKMNLPDQFIQPQSLFTLSGSAVLVWLVSGGLRYFLGFFRKWVPLLVSAVVVILVRMTALAPFSSIEGMVLVGNIFLLAFTAVGLNETISRGAEKPRSDEHGEGKRVFLGSWFG